MLFCLCPNRLEANSLMYFFFFFWEADLTVVSYGILYMERNSKDIFSNVSSVSSLLMFAFFHPQEATVFFWSLIVWQSVCLVRLVRILFLGRQESWHKYSLFSRRAVCFSISPRWKHMPFISSGNLASYLFPCSPLINVLVTGTIMLPVKLCLFPGFSQTTLKDLENWGLQNIFFFHKHISLPYFFLPQIGFLHFSISLNKFCLKSRGAVCCGWHLGCVTRD